MSLDQQCFRCIGGGGNFEEFDLRSDSSVWCPTLIVWSHQTACFKRGNSTCGALDFEAILRISNHVYFQRLPHLKTFKTLIHSIFPCLKTAGCAVVSSESWTNCEASKQCFPCILWVGRAEAIVGLRSNLQYLTFPHLLQARLIQYPPPSLKTNSADPFWKTVREKTLRWASSSVLRIIKKNLFLSRVQSNLWIPSEEAWQQSLWGRKWFGVPFNSHGHLYPQLTFIHVHCALCTLCTLCSTTVENYSHSHLYPQFTFIHVHCALQWRTTLQCIGGSSTFPHMDYWHCLILHCTTNWPVQLSELVQQQQEWTRRLEAFPNSKELCQVTFRASAPPPPLYSSEEQFETEVE